MSEPESKELDSSELYEAVETSEPVEISEPITESEESEESEESGESEESEKSDELKDSEASDEEIAEQRQLYKLFDAVIEYGFQVRSNGLDGLAEWKKIKPRYSCYSFWHTFLKQYIYHFTKRNKYVLCSS